MKYKLSAKTAVLSKRMRILAFLSVKFALISPLLRPYYTIEAMNFAFCR